MTITAEPMLEAAQLPPFAENVYAPSDDGYELVGARCERCDRYFFPLRGRCPECLGSTRQTRLGSSGVIYSYTVIRTRPPFGLPQPYAVAYIDLDGIPLRVFSLLDAAQIGDLRIGARVRLAVAPLGVNIDAEPCQRPFFRLSSTTTTSTRGK